MDIFFYFFLSLVLIALNIFVIIKLFKSSYFSKTQKIYQSIFIFLLPFIGAFIVLYIIRDTGKKNKRPKGRFGGGNEQDIKYPW